MTPEVTATHERINVERKKLYDRFKEEFGHELNDEKIGRVVDTLIKPPKTFAESLEGVKTIQVDVIKTARKRGRPAGSKNKPKAELVRPSLIGHVPANDLIINRQD